MMNKPPFSVVVAMHKVNKDVLLASKIAHCDAPCSVEIIKGEPTDDLITQKLNELISGKYQGKTIRSEKMKLRGKDGVPYEAVVFFDDSDFASLVDELLGKGEAGLLALVNYFILCGNGAEDEGWWNNIDTLVKLVRRFSVSEGKKAGALEKIIHHPSNIYEYHRWVVETAKLELAELHKKQEHVPEINKAIPKTKETTATLPEQKSKTERKGFFKRIFKK